MRYLFNKFMKRKVIPISFSILLLILVVTLTLLPPSISIDSRGILSIGIKTPIVYAAAIDIGSLAIERGATAGSGTTYVDEANPSDGDGTITTVWVYTDYVDDITVGTYYVISGNILKCRDSEYVSAHESPGLHEYSVDIDVQTGDYLGGYFTAGKLELDTSGGTSIWHVSGEYKDPGDQATFSTASGYAISIYGEGTTVSEPDISNAPASWAINGITGNGAISTNTTYYSNPNGDTTQPNATVVDGDCYFTLTNDSTVNIDIVSTMTDFSGGDADMTNSNDGSNGATSYGAYAWYSGMTYSNKVIVQTSGSDILWTSSSPGDDIKWGIEVNTRTDAFTGPDMSQATITITASAS